MKRITALFLTLAFAATLFAFPAREASAAADYSTIKVKLTTNNATVISMSVKGEYFLNENGASFHGGTLTLRANADGTLTVSHSTEGELYTGASVSVMRAQMKPSAGYMYFNSRSYLGHFNVRVLSSGFLQVVNVVPLAHYLYGVVGHEMSNTFPIEALKAQAVAAKCYVLTCMKTGNSEYYIGDTSSDQVYKGYTASNTNVIRAVDETLSEILTVNGSMLCTYYAASNGGETNLVTYAWNTGKGTNAGYAISLDEYDFKNTMSPTEKVRIPINQVGSISRALYDMLLAKAGAVIGVTPTGLELIKSVEVYSPRYQNVTRNMTRVKMVLGVIADGYLYDDIELDFSVADLSTYGVFRNAALRTCWGEYDAASGCYVIYHARWGHGVGMSQRGAQQRALEGWNYRDILQFYYPGASFSTIQVAAPVDPVKPGETPEPPETPAGTTLLGYGVTTGDVNFRKGPGTDYESYGKLSKGSEIPIYGKSGSWYRSVVNGCDGYVSASYISFKPLEAATPTPAPTSAPTPTPTPTPAPEQPAVLGAGSIAAKDVNFRTGPATSYSSLKKLARGTELIVYALQNGWYYVNVEGIYGYVSAQYVKLTEAAPTPEPEPEPETTFAAEIGSVTRSAVNFRADASSASARLRQFEKNACVYVLKREGNWYQAVADGQFGFIYADYVKLTGEKVTLGSDGRPLSPEAPRPETGKGITTGNVNFRKGPGTSYASMGTLKKGIELTLLALTDGWYQVALGEQTGYVSSKYISVTEKLPENSAGKEENTGDEPEPAVPDILGLGKTTTQVNFREQASSSSKKLGQIKSGETVTLYSLSGGWYAAEYTGTRGYLSAKYGEVIAENAGEAGGVTPEGGGSAPESGSVSGVQLATGAATGKLNFRDRPSTSAGNVLATLKQGEKMQILGETSEWYYALYNGRAGFAYKAYVKIENSGSSGIARVSDSVAPIVTATTANVNLRKGMSTKSEIICLLPAKAAVTVYMIFDGWCFLSCNGAFGFAVTDYVKLG